MWYHGAQFLIVWGYVWVQKGMAGCTNRIVEIWSVVAITDAACGILAAKFIIIIDISILNLEKYSYIH